MEYWSSSDTEKDKNELIEKKNNILLQLCLTSFYPLTVSFNANKTKTIF
jgi:hypothetical protein